METLCLICGPLFFFFNMNLGICILPFVCPRCHLGFCLYVFRPRIQLRGRRVWTGGWCCWCCLFVCLWNLLFLDPAFSLFFSLFSPLICCDDDFAHFQRLIFSLSIYSFFITPF